ncbi:unnamed protein product [Clavelina lepadiformis]|uniref:Uncharacterized protein n=1 Tax=Clavelina lepadiformis TaxID=159417 RepID=A0ABP0G9N8_CLALP
MDIKNKSSTKKKHKNNSKKKSTPVRRKDKATKTNNAASGPADESLSAENILKQLNFPQISSSSQSQTGVEQVLSTSEDTTTSLHTVQHPTSSTFMPTTAGIFSVKAQFVILGEKSVQKKKFGKVFPKKNF